MSLPSPSPRPRTALVTLGRLPVALDVVRALRRAGYRVLVADPLPVHLCRLSRDASGHRRVRAPVSDPDGYLDDLIAIIERDGVSLVVPVSEETPHVARLHGRTAAQLLCSSHWTLLSLHDKLAFAQLCERIGVAVPTTVRAHASDALCAAADWVQKPRLSCSGAGVHLGRAGQSAALQPGTLVQRRIDGEALCTFAFALRGEVVCQLAYRDLLASGSVSVMFEAVALPDAVARMVERIVAATEFTGMIAFDVLHDGKAGWLPIECNPRATSGLHLLDQGAVSEAFARLIGETGQHVGSSGPLPADGVSREPTRTLSLLASPPGKRRQAFWSALLALQVGALRELSRRLRGARRDNGRLAAGRHAVEPVVQGRWRALLSVRDIVWQARDPLPFLMMTPGSAPLLWRAWRSGRPIVEVATRDVGWYRPPLPPS